MDEPVPLMSVTKRFEADMVCDLLRTAGLECGMTRTASDSAFAGVLAGQIMILVHASDLEAGREVLAGADSR
jgi:Putative prokaryotic signal transducing protein